MFVRGLKAKIALNIAILLFVAMLLIVLVTMVTVKRELIRSEMDRANILLASLEGDLLDDMSPAGAAPPRPPRISSGWNLLRAGRVIHCLMRGGSAAAPPSRSPPPNVAVAGGWAWWLRLSPRGALGVGGWVLRGMLLSWGAALGGFTTG